MIFKKIGRLKEDKEFENSFLFKSSFNNEDTIQKIDRFYFNIDTDPQEVKFKILKKTENFFQIKILDSYEYELKSGLEVYVKENQLPKLDKNEFYNDQLIGCSALSEESFSYGEVKRVLNSSNGTIIEIFHNDRTYLVPFNVSFIIKVDLNKKIIIIKNLDEISQLWKLIPYQLFLILLKTP